MPSSPVRGVILALVLLASATTVSQGARAHGLWGHVHVTGWALENLPPGELRDFFAEPEVRAALLFGASFPDSGYAPRGDDLGPAAREYGEHAHWEPFVQDFIAWILANEPPPFTTFEQRRHVAFLMGCAAHGLQDEIFDSLFLYQVEERDFAGQAEADPATDGFLALDGHLRFIPEKYLPFEVLLPLFADLSHEITAELIEGNVNVVLAGYLNDSIGMRVAEGLGREYDDQLPWTREHYLDLAIPGSLLSEVDPTGAYMQAIWDRLHGRFAEAVLVTHRFPDPPRRLLSGSPDSPDSWVTLVFGVGLENGTDTARFVDESGDDVVFIRRDTRFTGSGWSRLMRYQPNEALVPGATYTVYLDPGPALIDGTTLAQTHEHTFQVDCDPPDEATCPDLGELPEPVIDPPEPTLDEAPDAPADAGEADVGPEQQDDGDADGDGGSDPEGDSSDGAGDVVADLDDEDTDASEPTEVSAGDDGCGCGAVEGGAGSDLWLVLVGAGCLPRRRRARSRA